MNIHTTGRDEVSPYLKILLAGHPGAGKTRFAAAFPGVLIANARAGLSSIAEKGVRYVNITSETELLAMQLLLRTDPAQLGGPVETLVIDTLDEISRFLLLERLQKEKRSETTPGDYGWLGQRLHVIVEELAALPMHVIFVTRLKEVNDGMTGDVSYKPAIAGAFSDQVHQYVDFSLLMKVRSYHPEPEFEHELGAEPKLVPGGEFLTQHYLRSYADHRYEWVRDSLGVLPPEYEVNFTNDWVYISELVNAKRDSLPESSSRVASFEDESLKLERREGGADNYIQQLRGKPQEPIEERPKPVIEQQLETPAETPLDTLCTDCGNGVENQDRVDLSMIRYRTPLCGRCFDNRRKR